MQFIQSFHFLYIKANGCMKDQEPITHRRTECRLLIIIAMKINRIECWPPKTMFTSTRPSQRSCPQHNLETRFKVTLLLHVFPLKHILGDLWPLTSRVTRHLSQRTSQVWFTSRYNVNSILEVLLNLLNHPSMFAEHFEWRPSHVYITSLYHMSPSHVYITCLYHMFIHHMSPSHVYIPSVTLNSLIIWQFV